MPFPNNNFTKNIIEKYFERKRIPYTEDAFINVLQSAASSKMDVYWATIGLRDVGTAKCIPFLKEKLHYPKQDVKDCSVLTIAHIAGSAETEFYISAFKDKKTRKGYPIWAILDAADHRAVEVMMDYVRDALRKIKRGVYAGDYLDAMKYLGRFSGADPRIVPLFADILGQWEKLQPGIQEQLRNHVPYFSQYAPSAKS
jgi:hypothetical protein